MTVLPVPASIVPHEGLFRFDAATSATGPCAELLGLPLHADGSVRLRLGGPAELGDEGYELRVRTEGVVIAARTVAGLRHGVATLRQLRGTGSTVSAVTIVDRPRYSYRGVMLDVARHFFPVADVLRLVDLAALLKLNHLHLHLTDDQGWRVAIDSWPRLAEFGGGTEVGDGPGGHYTKADYTTIVEHAAASGITVVPEVDVPGHTNAALASYGVLAPGGVAPERYRGIEVGFSALAVGTPAVDRFLDDVFGELAALTPGPWLHFGGDEVKTLSPVDYAGIVTRAQEVILRHGKTPIGWHEVAQVPLLPATVVQYWGVNHAPMTLATGNRVIMSPADRTYLDMKYDASTPVGYDWAGHLPTPAAHDWDPETYLSSVDPSAVLGIEAPLWTETVRNWSDAQRLLMPRLAVLAEVGWSTPSQRASWSDVAARLAAQAPLWTALGIDFHRDPSVPWSA